MLAANWLLYDAINRMIISMHIPFNFSLPEDFANGQKLQTVPGMLGGLMVGLMLSTMLTRSIRSSVVLAWIPGPIAATMVLANLGNAFSNLSRHSVPGTVGDAMNVYAVATFGIAWAIRMAITCAMGSWLMLWWLRRSAPVAPAFGT